MKVHDRVFFPDIRHDGFDWILIICEGVILKEIDEHNQEIKVLSGCYNIFPFTTSLKEGQEGQIST